MPFDLEVWKEKVQQRLQEWKPRMQAAGAHTVYGFLSALALWPLVEAAQAGQLLPVGMALGNVAGVLGGTLLANQVQAWKDRTAADVETEAAAWVETQATEPDVRDAIDAILLKLEVLPAAQSALSEPERAWFQQVLREELGRLGNLSRYEALLDGSGAIAQGEDAMAGGERAAVMRDSTVEQLSTGDNNIQAQGHVIFAEQGATVIVGEIPVVMTAVKRDTAQGRYLTHFISQNRYLHLQGIRSGGRLVDIELDRIYVTLRATRQRLAEAEETWLAAEAGLAPGEMQRWRAERGPVTETVTVSVNEALAAHPRLVVLGDPGCGKTTLLRYLALQYARDVAEGGSLVRDRLGLDESGRLPVLLPLRQIGAFLKAHHGQDDGTEGSALLLEFLSEVLKQERILLPADFFDAWLEKGRAVVLLDGLDEVADPDLRRRVARLVEAFARAYPDCRYVVTSRIVGYTGPARLGEQFTTTTVRDFTLADVEHFLASWHLLIAMGQLGPGPGAEAYAAGQTRQLLAAIAGNERIRELAINPLMLSVIAMVHRDRVKLPDRRAELYAEAVDVLLGKWDEAKGAAEPPVLLDKPFDTGDKRLMLQGIALAMHEAQQKEVAAEALSLWVVGRFEASLGDRREAERAFERFLRVIEERTGLLVARGEGVYAFSHLTFQEYLAALEVAGREDYIAYTLARTAEAWWREVILLEAGHLSTQSIARTERLIQAIADLATEPQPYHNLVLASECLRDVGPNRVGNDLVVSIQRRLRQELERKPSAWSRWRGRAGVRGWIERRSAAVEALAAPGAASGRYLMVSRSGWRFRQARFGWAATSSETAKRTTTSCICTV